MEAATAEKVIPLGLILVSGEIEVEVEYQLDRENFVAEFGGETFTAETLASLRRHLKDYAVSYRTEAPFVSAFGRRGVMRGWHAGNHDILVTWDDDQKGRLSPHERVWTPEGISDAEVAEIQAIREQQEQLGVRLAELQEGREEARVIFARAVGEDLTASGRGRES